MALDGGPRHVRDLFVRDRHGIFDQIGDTAETGTEDHPDHRRTRVTATNRLNGARDWPKLVAGSGLVQSSFPTQTGDTKEAPTPTPDASRGASVYQSVIVTAGEVTSARLSGAHPVPSARLSQADSDDTSAWSKCWHARAAAGPPEGAPHHQ